MVNRLFLAQNELLERHWRTTLEKVSVVRTLSFAHDTFCKKGVPSAIPIVKQTRLNCSQFRFPLPPSPNHRILFSFFKTRGQVSTKWRAWHLQNFQCCFITCYRGYQVVWTNLLILLRIHNFSFGWKGNFGVFWWKYFPIVTKMYEAPSMWAMQKCNNNKKRKLTLQD